MSFTNVSSVQHLKADPSLLHQCFHYPLFMSTKLPHLCIQHWILWAQCIWRTKQGQVVARPGYRCSQALSNVRSISTLLLGWQQIHLFSVLSDFLHIAKRKFILDNAKTFKRLPDSSKLSSPRDRERESLRAICNKYTGYQQCIVNWSCDVWYL